MDAGEDDPDPSRDGEGEGDVREVEVEPDRGARTMNLVANPPPEIQVGPELGPQRIASLSGCPGRVVLGGADAEQIDRTLLEDPPPMPSGDDGFGSAWIGVGGVVLAGDHDRGGDGFWVGEPLPEFLEECAERVIVINRIAAAFGADVGRIWIWLIDANLHSGIFMRYRFAVPVSLWILADYA